MYAVSEFASLQVCKRWCCVGGCVVQLFLLAYATNSSVEHLCTEVLATLIFDGLNPGKGD